MASKKVGKKEQSPDRENAEPQCCAVVVLRADGKGKTVLPLKMEDGEMKIGDKTLKIQCDCE